MGDSEARETDDAATPEQPTKRRSSRRGIGWPAAFLGASLLTSVLGLITGAVTGSTESVSRVIAVYFLLVLGAEFIFGSQYLKNRSLQKELNEAVRVRDERSRSFAQLMDESVSLHKEQLAIYQLAVQDVIAQQAGMLEEELEIRVIVGSTDEEDRVYEEVLTRPTQRIGQTSIRPILPDRPERIYSPEDIEFECHALNRTVKISWLPLVQRTSYLRLWILFDQPITEPLRWAAEYRSVGLLRPLRETGSDVIRFQNNLPTKDNTSPIKKFKVKFIFPPGDDDINVAELMGRGNPASAVEFEGAPGGGSGQRVIEWTDDDPAPGPYSWRLTKLARREDRGSDEPAGAKD